MGIDKGNSFAMNSLGHYYENKGDEENMVKYYLMAIDKGDSDAMYNIKNYCKQHKKYDLLVKLYHKQQKYNKLEDEKGLYSIVQQSDKVTLYTLLENQWEGSLIM